MICIIILPKLAEKNWLLLVHFVVWKRRVPTVPAARPLGYGQAEQSKRSFSHYLKLKCKSCTEEKAQIDLETTSSSNPSSDISSCLNDQFFQVCSSLLHSFCSLVKEIKLPRVRLSIQLLLIIMLSGHCWTCQTVFLF